LRRRFRGFSKDLIHDSFEVVNLRGHGVKAKRAAEFEALVRAKVVGWLERESRGLRVPRFCELRPIGAHDFAEFLVIGTEGAKVTHAALEVGYSTPSAFIAMLGKTLGTTPTSYFGTGGRGR
jgi:AraC-like DNA-binding protein